MADSELTELTEETNFDGTELGYFVKDATGTPTDVSGQMANVVNAIVDAARIRALGFFDTSNDGDSSGLDADMVDGNEATALLARANHTGSQASSTISDFTEAVEDVVGALVSDGTTVTFTYDDVAGTLTAEVQNLSSSNLSDFTEAVEDTVGSLMSDTVTVAWTYDDVNGTLSAAVQGLSLSDISDSGALAALDTVGTSQLDDDAVTYAKMQDVSATDRLLGRDTAGAGTVEEISPSAARTMLNVEDGATADQTAAEIKTAYESNADTNAYTDSEKTVVGNTSGTNTGDEPSATLTAEGVVELATTAEVDTGTDATRAVTPSGLANSALQTKVDGIESGATADQTAAEIKTAYESNADTNEFSDSEQTKLAGVESGATADQTASEIKTAYESNADTNAFTDADHSKLDGVEASADVTDATNVAAAGAAMTANNLSDLASASTARSNLDLANASRSLNLNFDPLTTFGASSTTEDSALTSTLTIPANTLSDGDTVELVWNARHRNDSGSSNDFTWTVVLDTYDWIDWTITVPDLPSGSASYNLNVQLLAKLVDFLGIRWVAKALVNVYDDSGAFDTTESKLVAYNSATKALTSDIELDITVQNTVSDASIDTLVQSAVFKWTAG